jgi:lambda repressor-like predicted transcriptional regulator
MGTTWSETRNARIVEGLKAGRSVADVARECGVAPSTVYSRRSRLGPLPRAPRRRPVPVRPPRPWPAWPNWQNEAADNLPSMLAATWTSLQSVKATLERLAAVDYRQMVWAEGDKHRQIIANHERLVDVWSADVQGMIEALRKSGMTDDQIERHMPDSMERYMTVIAEDCGVEPWVVIG